jgi:hypothetical protein
MTAEESNTNTSTGTGDTTVERWTYGGMRLSTKNTKLAAWVDPHGAELFYRHKSGNIVGCCYDVHLRRDPDNGRVTMYGSPVFVGPSDDRELATRLAAEERACEQELAVIQRQRKAKASNPLDAKIEELALLVKKVPAPQRAGLTAYILHKLIRAW